MTIATLNIHTREPLAVEAHAKNGTLWLTIRAGTGADVTFFLLPAEMHALAERIHEAANRLAAKLAETAFELPVDQRCEDPEA